MSDAPATDMLVVCLCAEWCGSCREYRQLFDAPAREQAAVARFVWADIEDHGDTLGGVDIENFPTLLIARSDEVLFFGPVTPHAQTLARLVQAAVAGDLAPLPAGQHGELLATLRGLADAPPASR
jgi:thioredoxin 1